MDYHGEENYNITAVVETVENDYFTPPLGSSTLMRISFFDDWNTKTLFQVMKKSKLRSLRDLGATSVANALDHIDDIASLDVPNTLLTDLAREYMNDWSPRYHRQHIEP